MIDIAHEELDLSGRTRGWRRGADPRLEAGVLLDKVEEPQRAIYQPFEEPNLPNALAKVTDEKSALRFALNYGSLGFADLVAAEALGDDEEFDEDDPVLAALQRIQWGDPLDWVLAQAASVRLAIELIEALGDEEVSLDSVLDRYRLRSTEVTAIAKPEPGGERRLAAAVFSLALGTRVEEVTLLAEGGTTGLAQDVVLRLVSANIGRAGEQLEPSSDSPHGFTLRRSATALIEVVWWHVQQWAARGKLRLCTLCDTPFMVTHEAQRFCPADYVFDPKRGHVRPQRSRCLATYQKRLQRRKKGE